MTQAKNKFIPRHYIGTQSVDLMEETLGFINTKGDNDFTSINISETESITLNNSDIFTPGATEKNPETLVLGVKKFKQGEEEDKGTIGVYNSKTKETTQKYVAEVVNTLLDKGFTLCESPRALTISDKFERINKAKKTETAEDIEFKRL